ncbi:D-methionine transport system ATP-binding protein [Acetitomaculum ruminis DSM 5522]|uniref:D-methionine transport system ATP-binding protein n=1 Tax=Acetitomaculum ruminis DSM 5522 TaxID=1120918 RepID=A0A1I0Y9M2_9FIRM|nr:ATP-binding cassette domain-containing protein [Acetitomaculum ruminis]SFB10049.1 D-methionine transport system ATP-binding protein [Acetitomaculum ruminis DSM 5522]
MNKIIRVVNVSKKFKGKEGEFIALNNINLEIGEGDIYGIIGMSGAGKSTLVRCLNFLEVPTQGTVYIQDKDLRSMKEKELLEMRKGVSMIFQHFNLLMQKNVVDNICFPLLISGYSKKDAKKRAYELLKIVDLDEKATSYPAQLSGGQKQRVAIARALASNPKILLCDEATSALDPQTTQSILALLKQINKEYGITIVIITHEMDVIQQICSHVAILDHGNLVETGSVTEIFTSPKTKEAKRLIYNGDTRVEEMKGKRCIRIVFSENSSFEPVIANMILECKAPVNILLADTRDIGGRAAGEMILQLPQDEETANKMIEYLKSRKLAVEEVKDYV